jgi:hypothetical protein
VDVAYGMVAISAAAVPPPLLAQRCGGGTTHGGGRFSDLAACASPAQGHSVAGLITSLRARSASSRK